MYVFSVAGLIFMVVKQAQWSFERAGRQAETVAAGEILNGLEIECGTWVGGACSCFYSKDYNRIFCGLQP
jgi:hypothetical protein